MRYKTTKSLQIKMKLKLKLKVKLKVKFRKSGRKLNYKNQSRHKNHPTDRNKAIDKGPSSFPTNNY